jgi:DEAD/DEAH box helicase domain-containing protein
MSKLVLDIETKRSFNEVGGRANFHKLGVSVVGVYHYEGDKFACYREEHFDDLAKHLKNAEEIIGFNLVGFDWPVLAAELGEWVRDLPTLDLMLEAQKVLGHRISLDSLAKATLGTSKIGSGLDALEYYRVGDWQKLERYCLEDVKITRDLYEYAKRDGQLYFNKAGQNAPVAMSFAESPLAKLLRESARTKASVKLTYKGKTRVVDVRSFDGMYLRGFCHSAGEGRTFRLDRVEDAERVDSSPPLFD